MRYQSAVASSREVSFARQLFRIIFFIIAVEQDFAEPLPESFRCKIPLDPSAVTNRNRAGLLGNNHGDRVGFLRNAQTRAMPQAEAAIEGFALAYRKNAGRRSDPTVAKNYAAIV